MNSIDQRLSELASDFDVLGDPDAQLNYVMDLGRALPPFSPHEMSELNRVRGCASRLWLITKHTPDGRMTIRADADALIPKGLAAVVIKLLSGERATQIAQYDLQAAFERLGLPKLSMSRASGLGAMAARIKREAQLIH